MKTVTVHAAKTHLSGLIKSACAGEEIIIARRRVPVVRLVPVERKSQGRRFGALRGRLSVDDSFFDPLPDEEVARWGGGE